MNIADITGQRLHNQLLSHTPFTDPVNVCQHFCAVQSQDFAAAKWALGLRLKNATDNSIERAFNDGRILRTHVLRPTWHFVAPEDIRWLQSLTAHRVIAIINNSGRKLGLEEKVYRRCGKLLEKSLRDGNYLTRQEIGAVLNKAGIATGDLHMVHLLMRAELDGLLCSGPRAGKQFTYALLEERVPPAKKLTADEALATLTQRYFASHGPATLQDYAWWSGLKTADAKAGVELVKAHLASEICDGQTYWFLPTAKAAKAASSAFLLPNFDEYMVAYKDRHLLVDPQKVMEMPGSFVLLSNTVVVDGRVVGTWKRTIGKHQVTITWNQLHSISKKSTQQVAKAAKQYGAFYGLSTEITDAGS